MSETNSTIHWIGIYPVDSVIQLLNSWGLLYIYMKPEISLTIGIWNPRFMDKEY